MTHKTDNGVDVPGAPGVLAACPYARRAPKHGSAWVSNIRSDVCGAYSSKTGTGRRMTKSTPPRLFVHIV